MARTKRIAPSRFLRFLVALSLLAMAAAAYLAWIGVQNTPSEFEQYRWEDTKYASIRTRIAETSNSRMLVFAEYPVTENQAINAVIHDKIDEFRTEFSRDTRSLLPKTRRATLNISYQVTRYTDRYASISVSMLREVRSHKSRDTAYWTFDLTKGNEVRLSDVFADQRSDGIARVILYLKQSIAAKLAKSGASADDAVLEAWLKPNNFFHFLTTDDRTLRFDFAPGAVANEAYGQISVSLPIDNLQLFMQNDTARQLFAVTPIGQAPEYVPPVTQASASPNCEKLKCIALTFDDGPGPHTAYVLDILKNNKAHASFFLIGKNIAKYPEALKRMVAEGHTIGNHSWSHPRLTNLSEDRVMIELSRTTNAIQAATGKSPSYVRPPNGAIDKNVYDALGKMNMTAVLWSVDTRDWADRKSSVVANRVIAGAKPGAIVVLHDVHKSSVEALPNIITTLKSNGYTFVSLEELFGPNAAPGKAINGAS